MRLRGVSWIQTVSGQDIICLFPRLFWMIWKQLLCYPNKTCEWFYYYLSTLIEGNQIILSWICSFSSSATSVKPSPNKISLIRINLSTLPALCLFHRLSLICVGCIFSPLIQSTNIVWFIVISCHGQLRTLVLPRGKVQTQRSGE